MRLTTIDAIRMSTSILLLATLAAVPAPAFASRTPHAGKLKPLRIVIDPGHGGDDEGSSFADSRGGRITEKDVTLALARRVAGELRAKGYSVFLTRETDLEIPLAARTALANRLRADVFLSIHMNSTANNPRDAEGVETYILNNATDASSRRLAHLENSVLGSFDTGTPEKTDVALILKDLRLDANLSDSKRLACAVQENLVSATSRLNPVERGSSDQRRNRGVRQALFHVLLGADMPSILLEAGFLTSARDRAIVTSPRGQHSIAQAIARAIDQYKRSKQSAKTSSALSRCKVN